MIYCVTLSRFLNFFVPQSDHKNMTPVRFTLMSV